jgi:aromatase
MSTNQLTLEALSELVTRCTGVTVTGALLRQRPESTFADLGVDSLGVLGVIAACERASGALHIDLGECPTPAALLEAVNVQLAGASAAPATPGHTDNTILIHAPFDLVWTMTNDVASWPHLFSEYAGVEILHRSGDTVRFRLTMHPDEQDRVWSWVSERTVSAERAEATAHRVETGPFQFMHIRWTYQHVPEGVRMRWIQDFAMKPGGPVDTAGMTDHINRHTVVQQRRIKSLVEQRARELGSVGRR